MTLPDMPPDDRSVPQEMQREMAKALKHPVRARVLVAVWERSGITVGQISSRIDQPPRKVRHHLGLLVDAGLVVVEGEAARRNTRERHYRATVPRILVDGHDPEAEDEDVRKIQLSIMRMVVEDVRRASGAQTLGGRPDEAVIRIPGEIDEKAWAEINRILVGAMVEIEASMRRGATRLRSNGGTGIEVISALLLFETPLGGSEAGVQNERRPVSGWLDFD